MPTVFFTGFPGFLGSELLPRVLSRAPETRAACLVQPKFLDLARQRAEQIMGATPALRGRIDLIAGDITQRGLGLTDGKGLQADTREIYHLAAIYDLSVARDFALRVNVDGTRHVLDFAEECPALQRFQYVSTCYVSGRYDGVFTEADLVKGQRFNNFYEETKYLAEVDVQQRMQQGLPATIYRPAIVVGDSDSGATQKYDGPYFVIQWLLRNPGIAVLPVVGDPKRTHLNVVPRDFITEAITHLSALPAAAGQVYQLADPEPLTIDQMLTEIARATERRVLRVPLPRTIAKLAIDHVPGVYPLLRIPSSSIDYFVHPTRYATTNTRRDLEGTGIRVPPFAGYVERLVGFVRQHPEVGAAAMA